MPTGYTAPIEHGISFEKFALNCARAFGACVSLRDEPGGGEAIPEEFAPSDYHEKNAARDREELAAVIAMTPQEREQAAAKKWEDGENYRLAALATRQKLRAAYEEMLAKVNAWVPPTPDHVGLKTFMRNQIENSIDFDCGEEYYSAPKPRLSGEQWALERTAQIARDIEYHAQEYAEELKRTADRTAWVKALRASLGGFESAPSKPAPEAA